MEAEEIKKSRQEYTEELYKKDPNDPDNRDSVITHLETDILECEVTANKANGSYRIPVELFQILNDDAVKVLYSICQQIWKTEQWPQDWKIQFSFQSQRRTMPKNVQTTMQLHSSHMLAKQCSKFYPGCNSMWTISFQIFKLDIEKAEEPEIKLLTSIGSSEM